MSYQPIGSLHERAAYWNERLAPTLQPDGTLRWVRLTDTDVEDLRLFCAMLAEFPNCIDPEIIKIDYPEDEK